MKQLLNYLGIAVVFFYAGTFVSNVGSVTDENPFLNTNHQAQEAFWSLDGNSGNIGRILSPYPASAVDILFNRISTVGSFTGDVDGVIETAGIYFTEKTPAEESELLESYPNGVIWRTGVAESLTFHIKENGIKKDIQIIPAEDYTPSASSPYIACSSGGVKYAWVMDDYFE